MVNRLLVSSGSRSVPRAPSISRRTSASPDPGDGRLSAAASGRPSSSTTTRSRPSACRTRTVT